MGGIQWLGGRLSGILQVLGRLRHPQASFLRPGSLGGLQWLGDQPLTCSWCAFVLVLSWYFALIFLHLGPFYHWLPPCYNIEIGCPVFDRIELNPLPTINEYHNFCIVDTCKCSGSFISCITSMYKQHNQSQALRYKHHLWQLIQYSWPMNLQGAYIQVYEICHFRSDNYDGNTYYWHYWWKCDRCVCHLLLGIHLSYCDMLVDISIDIIISALGTGNSWHLVIDSSYAILGRTFGAVIHCM